MNKFLTVLSHTFITTVRSKTFIITTLITAIMFGVIFSLPSLISYFEKDEEIELGVVDLTNEVSNPLKVQITNFDFTDIKIVDLTNEEEAKEKLEQGEVEGFLLIDYLKPGSLSVTFKAQKITDTGYLTRVEQALNQIQFRMKANTLGLNEAQAGQLFETVLIDKIPLDENARTEEEIVQSTVLVYLLLFAIYFGVIMYGNLVATEVTKEKSTRVMEILISSVNPIKQMFGKIIGIASAGLLQVVIYILIGKVAMSFGNKSVDVGDMIVDFSNIPTTTIVFAVIFFILGYFLYATIAAMLGSLTSRVEDLQQTLTPLNLIIIAAFIIAMSGLRQPNAAFITVTSFIPVFTPMIMFLRVGVGDPALWEVLLSVGLLLVSIFGIAVLAAKVYRGGVLMYGKGNAFKNLKKVMALRKEVRSRKWDL